MRCQYWIRGLSPQLCGPVKSTRQECFSGGEEPGNYDDNFDMSTHSSPCPARSYARSHDRRIAHHDERSSIPKHRQANSRSKEFPELYQLESVCSRSIASKFAAKGKCAIDWLSGRWVRRRSHRTPCRDFGSSDEYPARNLFS